MDSSLLSRLFNLTHNVALAFEMEPSNGTHPFILSKMSLVLVRGFGPGQRSDRAPLIILSVTAHRFTIL